MKKVVNFIKDYWITALICVGFVLLYKYISDHKLFSALMFPPLKGILESFVEDRDVTVLNLVSSVINSISCNYIGNCVGIRRLGWYEFKITKNLTSNYLCI